MHEKLPELFSGREQGKEASDGNLDRGSRASELGVYRQAAAENRCFLNCI